MTHFLQSGQYRDNLGGAYVQRIAGDRQEI